MMNLKDIKLGDALSNALTSVGITEERVSKALGRPCGCKKRREMMNRLNPWAERVNAGNTEDAERYLDEILEPEKSIMGSGEVGVKSPQVPE